MDSREDGAGTRKQCFPRCRNQLHLQRAQLQQALVDVRGGVEFAERLLTRGSDAEILSAKGVTLRRLSSLAECSRGAHPATVTPDDGSSIGFAAREPAGQVEGFPVVGVIVSKTVDVSKCTIEGKGRGTSHSDIQMGLGGWPGASQMKGCFHASSL